MTSLSTRWLPLRHCCGAVLSLKFGGRHYHVYKTVPLGHWGTEIVPLRVPFYGQANSAPRGTVLIPFFSECYCVISLTSLIGISITNFRNEIRFILRFLHSAKNAVIWAWLLLLKRLPQDTSNTCRFVQNSKIHRELNPILRIYPCWMIKVE